MATRRAQHQQQQQLQLQLLLQLWTVDWRVSAVVAACYNWLPASFPRASFRVALRFAGRLRRGLQPWTTEELLRLRMQRLLLLLLVIIDAQLESGSS